MSIGISVGYHLKRLAVLAGVLAFVGVSATLVDRALAQSGESEQAVAADEHIVTIHDRGNARVILTKATTIGGALEAAGIEVNPEQDVVEPSLGSELVATKYSVNIYRARPVTIVDGMLRQRITTAQQTPERIAEAAGVKLYPEDELNIEVANELALHGVDMVMKIDRATPLQFTLYGKKSEVRTQAETVGEFLDENDIVLGEKDGLSVPRSTKITAGMEVELWRDGKQTITVDEDIDFPVEQIQDANREVGYKEVRTPGEKGSRSVTYEIEMKNGKEVSREEIASVTTKQPKKQVEVVGTKGRTMPYTGGGDKTEWMRAAGIPESEWGYVDFIVGRESGWNPNATNRSSGACGLAQAYPCSKVPGNPLNPVDSLTWQYGYVKNRYGGYQQAYDFWQKNRWY